MGGFGNGNYSDLGTQNQTIVASSNNLFGAVSNAAKTGCEIAVDVTYHASATKGCQVQIERESTNTPGYESQESAFTVQVPFTAGETRTKVFHLPSPDFSEFQIRVVNNDTVQSVTAANCRIKQSTYS